MEKVINSYETMFIVDPTNGEDAIKATVNKFTGLISSNAELVEVNEWGKRRLAYPINDLNEGYYVVATFKAEAGVPVELDRNYNIDENIMRSMIVKLDFEAVKHETPAVEETAEEAPVAEATEEAPATETAE
ncbi:MAG: 30S ribosomal protein S6 [Clostridia bacterium]|nr:30S ribosomal protein S6 [Clostridia bacterium]